MNENKYHLIIPTPADYGGILSRRSILKKYSIYYDLYSYLGLKPLSAGSVENQVDGLRTLNIDYTKALEVVEAACRVIFISDKFIFEI